MNPSYQTDTTISRLCCAMRKIDNIKISASTDTPRKTRANPPVPPQTLLAVHLGCSIQTQFTVYFRPLGSSLSTRSVSFEQLRESAGYSTRRRDGSKTVQVTYILFSDDYDLPYDEKRLTSNVKLTLASPPGPASLFVAHTVTSASQPSPTAPLLSSLSLSHRTSEGYLTVSTWEQNIITTEENAD